MAHSGRSGSGRATLLDSRRNWYLLLQIGLPVTTLNVKRGTRRTRRIVSSFTANAAVKHVRIVQTECQTLGVKIRRLDIVDKQYGGSFSRYLFRFQRYKRDDAAATRLAESFVYGLSLAGSPLADAHEPLVMRVPDAAIREKQSLSVEKLLDLEKCRMPEERSVTFPDRSLAAFAATTADTHEAGWRIAALVFQNAALFNAARFMQSSYEKFYVYPGMTREVSSDSESAPASGAAQNRYEEALQSAFKAIEAVIGDPPKDDRRFFNKLTQIGINPHEEVGYGEKFPIYLVIREMNEARDKKSAHGATPNRKIGAAELLNFQACAGEVVLAALEHARGSSLSG